MWGAVLIALGGLMGAAGVAMQAAAAHLDGGDPARTGGLLLLIHAVAVLAVGLAIRERPSPAIGLGLSAALLATGSILFGAELGVAGLCGARPLPLAAPIGGFCMIGGWLGFALVGWFQFFRGRRDGF